MTRLPYQGSTIRIKNTLTDYDGSPLTPDSQDVRFYDPDGNLRFFTTSPTLESVGVYYVDYKIGRSELASDAAAGQKNVTVVAGEGSRFRVNDRVQIRDQFDEEENIIASITDDTLTMKDALINTYTVANKAHVIFEKIGTWKVIWEVVKGNIFNRNSFTFDVEQI